MAGEAGQTGETAGTAGSVGDVASGAAAVQTASDDLAPTVTSTTPRAEPEPEPVGAEPAGVDPVEPGATDEEIRLNREAFNSRIAQAKRSAEAAAAERHKAWLRERYGTDDRGEIDKLIADSKKLQEEAEERRRAEMSELDRYKADLAAERRKREAAERKVLESDRRRRYDKQDAAIVQIAGRHVDSDLVDDAALLFARHVRTELKPDEVAKMTPKGVEKWFADFVKRKPAWKRPAGAPDVEPKAKPRQAVTTGTPPNGQPEPVPTGVAAGRDIRPGRQNSMTRDELEEYKRTKGYNW